MSCIPCIVSPTSKKEWMAHLESGPAGPFMNQEIALRVAVIEALRLRRLGKAARVVVMDHNRDVRLERCLCQPFAR